MSLAATFRITAPLIVIGLVSLVLFLIVLIDILRRPDWQWRQAGSNKAMWLVLEIALFLLFGPLSIVSGIVYLAAARPKLVAAERSGDLSSRPVSPWDSGYAGGGSGYGTSAPYGMPPGNGPYGAPDLPSPSPGGGPPPYPGASGTPWIPGSPGASGGPGAADTAPPPFPPTSPPAPTVSPAEVAPSWQPDPSRRHELRYWDGSSWTEHVSDAGTQSTDPPVP